MHTKTMFLSIMLLNILVGSLVVNTVNASPELWMQTYGGSKADRAYALVETTDNGFALAGYTKSFGESAPDFWLVKTDENGNVQWNRTYGGSEADRAYSMVESSDGGYVIAGETNSFGAGNYDFWLVKTDDNGNIKWNKTYGGPGHDIAFSLIETSDGGYALAGYTCSFGNVESDFLLVKTDENGNVQWNRTYGGSRSDRAFSLIESSDGGYLIAGETNSFTAGNFDFWLVKTDAHGDVKWTKNLGGTKSEAAKALIETSDGGYAIAGATTWFGVLVTPHSNFWLVKTDVNGNMMWNQTYGEGHALSLVENSDGTFALAGDNWLIKTDAQGNMQWNQTYGGSQQTVVQTSDGGYAIAGFTQSYGAGSSDFWLIKTDSKGIPEFPSWAILPLIGTVTLVVLIYRKKLHATKQQN